MLFGWGALIWWYNQHGPQREVWHVANLLNVVCERKPSCISSGTIDVKI